MPCDGCSPRAGSGQASHGALADHIPLKLRQCGKNAEHHPARWRRGVDLRALAGEHPQTDTAIRQILHRADQVGERSAEPVELPNDEDIAVAQRFQAGGKTGAIITATGCTIIIDIAWLDTGSAKGIVLQVERLRAVGFGHAGVADQHGSQTKV